MVIRRLQDRVSVINSKQFPFSFFTAYDVIKELDSAEHQKLVADYQKALDNAVIVSTQYNLKPVKGCTIILCCVDDSMNGACGSAKGMGKPKSLREVGLLLGLMCANACEKAQLYVYWTHPWPECVPVQLEEGTILENMESVLKVVGTEEERMKDQPPMADYDLPVPEGLLRILTKDRVWVDNFMILASGHRSGYDTQWCNMVKRYRHLVNSDILIVDVDLTGRPAENKLVDDDTTVPENTIRIAGYSAQILQFIAERGDDSQLTFVDKIDTMYDLQRKPVNRSLLQPVVEKLPKYDLPIQAPLFTPGTSDWRHVRVFISSTFRDMHGERDMLTRYVFPELRRRAKAHRIHVHEVDLRWGITEAEASSDKLLEICLSEIDKCRPFFIGILGNRYGYTPQTYTPTPLLETQPQFDWLKTYPPGRSVTELEFQYGALRAPDKAKGRAFMYIRDNSFMKDVPAAYTKDFESENPQAAEKISMLKEQVRGSGLLAVDGYSCEWGAVVDGVPLVTGLETFGLSVLGNLWDAILDFAKEGTQQTADMQKPRYVEMLDREQYLHHLYVEHRLATFAGRERMLKELHRLVKDADTQVPGGVVSVAGHPGSGKTSFMSAFASSMAKTKHPATVLLTHFVGASPQSDDVRQMLNRLCHELRRRLALPDEIPEEYPELVKMFQHLLVESSVRVTANGGQIVLVIDGVDELSATYNAQSMDWLPPPDQLPAGVVIIVSVVESTLTSNTGQCARALRSRTPSALELVMGPLEALEKAEVARKVLGQYRKTLSEDPFDNQMRLLTGKKEAASPLFLVLACEELRTFGVFEKLTPFIKEIRQTTKELLQQLLGRMEADHGVPLVKMATSLLAMSRRGLLESEVVGMLGMASADLADLPVVKWCRLYHGLAPFLKPAIHGSESDTLLAFFHQEFTNAVINRYFHGPVSVKQVHEHMARYFEMAADPRLDGSYVGADARALSELPYHLLGAGKYEEAERMLCSLGFIEAKCKAHMSYDLLGDYVAALAAASPSTKFPSASAGKSSVPSQLEVYRGFVARNSHILAQMPSLTLQQALNEPDWSPVAQAAKTHLEDAPGRMMFRWRNKQQTHHPNIQRMTGFSQAMLCLATSPNGSQLACGSADGTVFLFEMATGKELAQLHGAHANAVTSICYVGSTLLCSASRDGSIFLWKLSGLSASKVGKLDKHTRQASAVCANTQGDLLLTAGWDGALHMWNPADGSLLGQLCDGHHPINTVAFHPEGRLAATGNWGGQIVIWDTFNRTMLKTLSPRFNPPLPSCSIRSVSFSPNGNQLLSADMNGTLAMWSVASGTCLSSVGASYLPINRCVFSPSGNELACVSDDPMVQVVTGRLGRGTSARPTRDMGPLLCIAMNPVYTVCAVGGHHQMCAVYNTMDGTWSYLPEHDSAVTAVEWAGDGLILVTGTASGVLRSFALHPGQEPQLLSTCDRSNSGHSGAITHVSIYGTTVVSASADFTLGLWNLDSGVLEAVTHLRGHDNTVTCSDWLPTKPGKVLASVSRDRSLCIWQIDGTQSHLILRREEAHSDSVTCCAYSPNGSILATGSNDFTIVLWSVGDYAKMCTLTGHLGIVTSLHFLTDETLLSSSFDLTVRAWSTATRDEVTTLQGHTLAVNALTSLPAHCENDSFISCGDDGQLCTWVIGWGRFRPYSGHSRRVCAATFADNTTLVTASHDHSISVWRAGLVQSQLLPNPTGGDEKVQAGQYGSMDAPHSFKGTGCVAVSRDGQYVVTGGATTMCLWMFGNDSPSTTLTGLGQINALCFVDPTTVAAVTNDTTMLILTWSHPYDMAVCNSFDLHCAGPNTRLPLTATAYCPDMGLIAVGGWAGHVDMYSISQNDVVMTLHGDGRGGWVTYLEVLHTGHHLAVCTDIGAVAIWDLTTQTQLHGINTPHWVTCAVVCSPDFAIVWYFTRLGATYPADFEAGDKQSLHQKSITAAHYHSPTGTLLTASEDGTLKAWRYSPQPNYPANKTLENLDPTTGFSAGISGISTPLSSGSLSSVRMVEHVSWVQIGCSVAKGPLTSLAVALTQGGLLCVAGDSLGHVYHLTFSLPDIE